MKRLQTGFLLLLLPLVSFVAVHKFYVSVTNINYAPKEDALQITSRVFTDDFENVLRERYDITLGLGTEEESTVADEYVEKYLRAKFLLRINKKDAPFIYIGKKQDNDVLIFYLEVPKVNYSEIKSIEIQNEVLLDLFEEQQNVVHFKLKDYKKSFILVKENNKGMLNL